MSPEPSGYRYARQHLPWSVVEAACDRISAALRAHAPVAHRPLQTSSGAPVDLRDGSTLTRTASPALCRAFPPPTHQLEPRHGPVVRLVVAHERDSGLAVRPAWGPQYGPQATREQALTVPLLAPIPAGAWVAADRNFGVFPVAWAIASHQHTPLVRQTEGRVRKRLGVEADLSRDSDQQVMGRPNRADRRTTPTLPETAARTGRVLVRHLQQEGQPVVLFLFSTKLSASADEWVAP